MSIEKFGLKNKKKILIVSQYFWPENFRINDIAKFLYENGNYEVSVLTGVPNYPKGDLFENYKKNPNKYKYYGGCEVVRVPMFLRRKGTKFNLFLNYISFNLSSIFFGFFFLRKKKFDIVLTFGTSPVTVALTGIFFSKIKKAKNVLWVLDLWPDVIYELNIIRNKILINFIKKIIQYIYKKSDLILAQSKSFKLFISKNNKFSNINKIIYFPSWSEFEKNIKIGNFIHSPKANKQFNILFTGNIGEAQNFDLVIAVAKKLKDFKNIKWTVVGEGRDFNYLKKNIIDKNLQNFFLEGQKDISEIKNYYNNADILLISLNPGKVISCTIPGKFQSYLSAGKPILGFIDGETKILINENKLGFASESQDPNLLANELIKLTQLSEIELENIRSRCFKLLETEFNKVKVLALFNNLLLKTLNSTEEKKDSTIKLLYNNNLNSLPDNYILSGLNLAFVGSLSSKEVLIDNDIYHWPDGLFKRRFFDKKVKKISGRNLIKELKLSNDIKRILICGNASSSQINYLKDRFNLEVVHIQLPYMNVYELLNFIPKFNVHDLIILTLPTPKQEQLAKLITLNNKHFKILCMGGALAMIVGDERAVPEYLENFWGAEAIWRLKHDTYRRTLRLIKTFYYYLSGELLNRYKYIRGTIIE
jgi:colanic acid biosynthesis glycosyl transferase WcaI